MTSIDFPLRGEWVAVTSPGDRVPSHGTDRFGQRYAYDFVRMDRRGGGRVHPAGTLRTLLVGFPTHEAYAWGEPVHMPFDGEIVVASDGHTERGRVVPLREMILMLKNALTFDPRRGFGAIAGNHVIARSGALFAALVHLAPGSVAVRVGEAVRTGDVIGRIGHSGNSTMPHLHLQLMDAADPLRAQGLPCAFRELEVERGGRWVRVTDHVPRRSERIRHPTAGGMG